MSWPFVKNQLLMHEIRGEVVALHRWNDKETVCLSTQTRMRFVAMNEFLEPVLGPGPNDKNICIIDEDAVRELEAKG